MAFLAILAVLGLGGCTATHRVPRDQTAHEKSIVDVSIAPRRAEVWAWTTQVGGTLPENVRFTSCTLETSYEAVIAEVRDGRWSAKVRLSPGSNAVHARCIDEHGRTHRSASAELRAMLRDAPTARVAVEYRAGEIVLDATSSEPSAASGAPITEYRWSVEGDVAQGFVSDGPKAFLVPKSASDQVTVRLEIEDSRGKADVARALASGRHRSTNDAIGYGVVPRLFGTPPLRAVTAKLDELAELGVDVLWLSPIFESPSHDYGYAVTDFFRVRSDYGTKEDLDLLVREAHARGLRVLLDFALNHTSERHPYFRDAEAIGNRSHYFGFHERTADGKPVHYFDWMHMPNLDYTHGEVEGHTLEAARHWIRDFQVDGYRIDAAWGVQRRAPAFYRALRAETRRIAPSSLLIAEASTRDPYWREHGFDAAYDWTDELGRWAWDDIFEDRATTADKLDAAVRSSSTNVVRFLENNDTGARFITRHGVDVTRVAAGALLTLPGMPVLFTGQERGAAYLPYERGEPLDASDPHGLRSWYRRLIRLRRELPALRGEGYTRAQVVPGDGRVLAYLRRDARSGAVALVVLRFDGREGTVRIKPPAPLHVRGHWRDMIGGQLAHQRGAALEIDLEPWSVHVLVPVE